MSIIDYFRPRSKDRLLRGERVDWIENNPRRDYIRQCVLSFPPWVSRSALKSIWEECRRLERKTGKPHVLDHHVPLNHERVCGLSVPWNLRAIPHKRNAAKSNHWCPEQTELCFIGDAEQMELF